MGENNEEKFRFDPITNMKIGVKTKPKRPFLILFSKAESAMLGRLKTFAKIENTIIEGIPRICTIRSGGMKRKGLISETALGHGATVQRKKGIRTSVPKIKGKFRPRVLRKIYRKGTKASTSKNSSMFELASSD